MSIFRRIVAGLCVPLLLAVGVLCLCPHGAGAAAVQRGCPSHAEEPPPSPTGDHAPACPHCGGDDLLPTSLADATPVPAHLALGAAPAALAQRLAPAFAVRSFAAPPTPLTVRSRLAHHCVLQV